MLIAGFVTAVSLLAIVLVVITIVDEKSDRFF